MKSGVKTQKFYDSADGTDIAVASTATVYTKGMKVKYFSAGSLVYQLTGTAPDVEITIQQSDEESANYVTPEGVSAIDAPADEILHRKPMDIDVSTWIRLKLEGINSNSADTTIAASVSFTEE